MTIRVDIERTIDRPIHEVFERLVDIDGYRRWMSTGGLFRDSEQTSDGPVEPGTEFCDRSAFGRLCGRVTDFERPRRVGFRQTLHWRGTPIFVSRPRYVLEPAGDGTRTVVHHAARGDFRGMLKLLEPLFSVMAERERNRVLDSLKDSLESG